MGDDLPNAISFTAVTSMFVVAANFCTTLNGFFWAGAFLAGIISLMSWCQVFMGNH